MLVMIENLTCKLSLVSYWGYKTCNITFSKSIEEALSGKTFGRLFLIVFQVSTSI